MSINYETLSKQTEALSSVVKMLHYMLAEQDGGNYCDADLDDGSAELINVGKDSFYRKGRANKVEAAGIEIEIVEAPDDKTMVVFIDTPGVRENSEGPRLRMYLNEEPLWENPTYSGIGESK